MLWIIQYPSIQILFIFWIVQLLYAGYATTTIKVNDFIKSLIIISLFIITYYTVELSKNWLGTPSFTDDEVVGTLDGYDKFIVNGKEMFSIMVTTKTGPFMFVMPYSPQIEKDLSESMAKKSTEGAQTRTGPTALSSSPSPRQPNENTKALLI